MSLESLVNCHDVVVNQSTVCPGLGAFAKRDFQTGEVIETGVARVLTNCDGHENPLVFTWSDETPNRTWAVLTGCAMFYNASNQPNTKMFRNFNDDTFIVKATKEIQAGQELFHTYKSLKWRKCFHEIRDV